jgi:hypothetical protein
VLTISKIGDIVQIAQNVLFVLKSFFEKQNRTLNDESGRRSFVLKKGEIRNAFSKKGFCSKEKPNLPRREQLLFRYFKAFLERYL